MIQVEHLTKRYGPHLAVDDLSFHVRSGEIFGFLGPNGAGKTTTMRILAGFLSASSGTARVGGHDVFTDSLAARRILGYLPENVPLYEEMRVSEYLRLRARLKEVPRREMRERVGRALDRLALGSVRRKLVGHLSRGYRQRVGIAACLLHDPQILLLDEPTLGLDPGQIRETRTLVRELGGEHTILLSSHILPEVEAVCNKVMILSEGKLRALDSPANLSRRLESEGTIVVEARGDGERARRAVEALPGVERVTIVASGPVFRLEVQAGDEGDLREAVSGAIVSAGGALRELRMARPTLEEVFVRITMREAGEGTEEGA